MKAYHTSFFLLILFACNQEEESKIPVYYTMQDPAPEAFPIVDFFTMNIIEDDHVANRKLYMLNKNLIQAVSKDFNCSEHRGCILKGEEENYHFIGKKGDSILLGYKSVLD